MFIWQQAIINGFSIYISFWKPSWKVTILKLVSKYNKRYYSTNNTYQETGSKNLNVIFSQLVVYLQIWEIDEGIQIEYYS